MEYRQKFYSFLGEEATNQLFKLVRYMNEIEKIPENIKKRYNNNSTKKVDADTCEHLVQLA